ncbi:hypothetical protein N7457_008211 [Penicillium paradoxum]|uniref:uncharacterized protein n=1 Tax=Penicillium paradoxum TaxID=176176 RepID=UPI002546F5E0|nr:uncharacterized protein N7457_008211 [Penicillium paradoxum]KAJ5773315.1 hypothetical protein N7457_008211 [Penicillium paradoxum]
MPPGRIPPVSNNPEKIQLERLSHVLFSHPDLEKFNTFAVDFGFEIVEKTDSAICYRGWGQDTIAYVALLGDANDEGFKGATFIAKTEADFTKSAALPGACLISDHKRPGGGKIVTIPSPSGADIHVLWGQQDRPKPEAPVSQIEVSKGGYNTTLKKERKGEFQRFKLGPAMIHKLGHYGYMTKKFDEDIDFYTSNFNFVPSDILYEQIDGQEIDTLTFMHLDHGSLYTDHHTLFLNRVPATYPVDYRVHHTSFEVEDFDTQLLGHEYLLSKGHKLVWGVGRHILGSQIFDYWQDPSGYSIEHYADGDVVNEDNPTGRFESEGAASMYIWGPIRPATGVAQ